jgi:hypothetical protein
LLIVKQPDLGTAILVFGAGFFVIYFAGISFKFLIPVMLIGAIGLGAIYANQETLCAAKFDWVVLHDYQKNRICTLLDPSTDPLGKGFHTIQSMIAIGAGAGAIQDADNAIAIGTAAGQSQTASSIILNARGGVGATSDYGSAGFFVSPVAAVATVGASSSARSAAARPWSTQLRAAATTVHEATNRASAVGALVASATCAAAATAIGERGVSATQSTRARDGVLS